MKQTKKDFVTSSGTTEVCDIDYCSQTFYKLEKGKYIVSFIPNITPDARMLCKIWLATTSGGGNSKTLNLIKVTDKPEDYNDKLFTYVFEVTDTVNCFFNLYFESAFNVANQNQTSLPWKIKIKNLSLAPYTATTSLIQQTANNITL